MPSSSSLSVSLSLLVPLHLQHRHAVYMRNLAYDECKRQWTQDILDARQHEELKARRLAQVRARKQEENYTKQLKASSARRQQQEMIEHLRALQEIREAEREEVDREIARLEHRVATDRKDLDRAVQQLRTSW